MKIIIEDIKEDEEEEIIIRCNNIDESILQMIYGVKMERRKIAGFLNGRIIMIEPKDVYYFESVDNKTFIYCENKVFETKLRLYEIEQEYEKSDFFRSSKSTILNISKIKSISPAFNGRFEALLKNNEKVIISRQFVPVLKKKLGI
ncbi:LytTR family DNA-binding domain-containing protein [uncultured Clostridium sp.]|uniref:LytTR family DNA-binding domain-containing protein n=1 Tax=uncultured Clostridium sp. TaxID=59620 RepID=UPI0025F0B5A1|nr:LytTR family DNA-binding domain-containing protein [uncultured Clostridium sp.]